MVIRSRRGWRQQQRPLASSLAVDPPANGDDGEGSETTPMVVTEEQHAVPSLGALLRFTIPTLGIWLAGPIMSLVRKQPTRTGSNRTADHSILCTHIQQVDTSVVGLSSDLELAGMGPATNLCDSFLYVFTFLAVVRPD